jgi:transcriptional regulator with XRE-family HTH domain
VAARLTWDALTLGTVRRVSKTEPEFPAYLRAAMARAGVENASDLSRLSGVSQSLISRWLADEAQPSIDALRRISPHIGAPLLELAVVAGHLTPDEAQMKDRPTPPEAPLRRGPLDGIDDPELEAALSVLVDRAVANNAAAKKRRRSP